MTLLVKTDPKILYVLVYRVTTRRVLPALPISFSMICSFKFYVLNDEFKSVNYLAALPKYVCDDALITAASHSLMETERDLETCRDTRAHGF